MRKVSIKGLLWIKIRRGIAKRFTARGGIQMYVSNKFKRQHLFIFVVLR